GVAAATPPIASRGRAVFRARSPVRSRGSRGGGGGEAHRFHRAMDVTAAYQVSLGRLGGASGALVGYPVLTFNQNMAVPTQDPRTVAAAIQFTDVTAGSGLAGVEALPDSMAGLLERGVALAVGDYDDDEA